MLWREIPLEVIKLYKYTRHIFGAKHSPSSVNYTSNRAAVDNAAMFPEAAVGKKHNFYVDDLDSLRAQLWQEMSH